MTPTNHHSYFLSLPAFSGTSQGIKEQHAKRVRSGQSSESRWLKEQFSASAGGENLLFSWYDMAFLFSKMRNHMSGKILLFGQIGPLGKT